jgi:predicted metal-dependent hydrolase
MRMITIFGKKYGKRKYTEEDSVQRKIKKIITCYNGKDSNLMVKEFLTNLLYSEMHNIYDQIRAESKIDVFGNLDFEVADKIDGKKQRIAKIKENKIIVKLNAVSLPKSALKYIIAHEMAHLITKKHGKKFWKIVESIYPTYEEGKKLFVHNAYSGESGH